MREISTSYYPPRARWYSPVFHLSGALLRQTHLDRLRAPTGIAPGQLIPSLLVPGWALFALGRRTVGGIMMAGYLLAAAVFVVGLGHVIANLAGGVMMSLHVTGVLYLVNQWLPRLSLSNRILLSGSILTVLSLGLYLPLRNQIERHLAMPLAIRGRVVVVGAYPRAGSVKRGELVAYQIDAIRSGQILLAEGYGLGVVHALAGDRVAFTPENFSVNGVVYPRRTGMPRAGEWRVPEKHWFIWPDLSISIHGNPVDVNSLSELMTQTALVPESEYVGKPFRRWFWKRQVIL